MVEVLRFQAKHVEATATTVEGDGLVLDVAVDLTLGQIAVLEQALRDYYARLREARGQTARQDARLEAARDTLAKKDTV